MAAVTSLITSELTVDPGSRATTTIRVRNSGQIVDRFTIDVLGDGASWITVDPTELSLFPGVEGTATVTAAPPRASLPRAGVYPFGVRVRSAEDPGGSSVEEGQATVTPFTSATADIAPRTSRGSRAARHRVTIVNAGNAPVEAVVTAVDPDLRLKFVVKPDRVVVGPDGQASIRVQVRVDDPFPFGQPRLRPFLVNVEPGQQVPIQLQGSMNQRSILPGWVPRVGAVAGAVVAIGIASLVFGLGPFAPKATPTPTPVDLAKVLASQEAAKDAKASAAAAKASAEAAQASAAAVKASAAAAQESAKA